MWVKDFDAKSADFRRSAENCHVCVGVPTAGLSTSHNRFTDVLYSFCTFFTLYLLISMFMYYVCIVSFVGINIK